MQIYCPFHENLRSTFCGKMSRLIPFAANISRHVLTSPKLSKIHTNQLTLSGFAENMRKVVAVFSNLKQNSLLFHEFYGCIPPSLGMVIFNNLLYLHENLRWMYATISSMKLELYYSLIRQLHRWNFSEISIHYITNWFILVTNLTFIYAVPNCM